MTSLSFPEDVEVNASGNLYIADTQSFRVRKVSAATGVITTIAGNGSSDSTGDGSAATAAGLAFPRRVAVDNNGNLFILDLSSTVRIRRVDAATGVVTSIAGGGTSDRTSGLRLRADPAPRRGRQSAALGQHGHARRGTLRRRRWALLRLRRRHLRAPRGAQQPAGCRGDYGAARPHILQHAGRRRRLVLRRRRDRQPDGDLGLGAP